MPPKQRGHSVWPSSDDSGELQRLYDFLKQAMTELGKEVRVPEIVVIGRSSCGKSSLLEALLGFRFNGGATRRPLFLHMIHDVTAVEPICRFKEENSEHYGSPTADIADLIERRTDSHLEEIRDTVSPKPIVIRIQWACWPTLTIIDTPGLAFDTHRRNERGNIQNIVKELVSPPHRLVLYLKSYRTKCYTWFEKIDPSFSRTVVVIPKLDDILRYQAFKDGLEVNNFFICTSVALGSTINPFYVAVRLPELDCSGKLSNQEFERQIREVDASVLRRLGDFNEATYGSYIGLSCLRKHLKFEIHKRYEEEVQFTMTLLQQRDAEISNKITILETKREAMSDVSKLRRSAHIYADSFCTHLKAVLLCGPAVGGPAPQMGKTTHEEHVSCAFGTWPGIDNNAFVLPKSSTRRLYGASAFKRLMDEIHIVRGLIDSPRLQEHEVEGIVDALTQHSRPIRLSEAAVQVARSAAQSMLPPFVYAACVRLEFILRDMFGVVVECNHKDSQSKNIEDMGVYHPFLDALRSTYYRFVEELSNKHKKALKFHIDLFNNAHHSIFSEDTPPHNEFEVLYCTQINDANDAVTPENRDIQLLLPRIYERSDVYFARILDGVMNATVPILKSGFLEPSFTDNLRAELANEFFCMEDKKFINMFAARGYLDTIENEYQSLREQQKGLLYCLESYHEAGYWK